MTTRALLPLLAALCLPAVTGCTVKTVNKPAAIQLPAGSADGKPARLQPGAPLAYWVWQSQKGIWHVRATTAKQKHTFQGTVRPMQGTRLSDPRSVSLGKGDKIGVQGDDIQFEFVTQGDDDGFDFRAVGNACIEFDLRVDGKPRPKLVVVGQAETTPASSNFIACP